MSLFFFPQHLLFGSQAGGSKTWEVWGEEARKWVRADEGNRCVDGRGCQVSRRLRASGGRLEDGRSVKWEEETWPGGSEPELERARAPSQAKLHNSIITGWREDSSWSEANTLELCVKLKFEYLMFACKKMCISHALFNSSLLKWYFFSFFYLYR